MTTVLAILRDPERSAIAVDRLASDIPGVRVVAVGIVDEALPHVADAEVLVTLGGFLGARAAEVYDAAPKLRWVQSIGTGVDNIAGHPALPPHVAVTNVRGIHAAQMSEAAIAALLSLARDLPRAVRQQAARHWERFAPRRLAGTSVGILGLGAIAEALAPRLKALGMTVVGISSEARAVPGFDRVFARADLTAAVADLDWLILLTPYSTATHHVVGATVLAAMRPTACLINLARGGVVDEAALVTALTDGTIAGAALDVFAHEPLPADSPLWALPNVVVTPHIGGFHHGYGDDVYAIVADNLRRFMAGEPLNNRI